MSDAASTSSSSPSSPPPVSAVLMAASKHVAVSCASVNEAFIACKKRDKDPAACLAAGDAVTSCVAGLLKTCAEKAPEEMGKYVDCLEYHSNKFEKCRKEQAAFEVAFPAKS